MSQIIIVLVLTYLVLAVLIIWFYVKERKERKKFSDQKKELSKRLYEISVLNSIEEGFGYSLNIKKIAETIAVHLEDLFKLSTVSYAIVHDDRIDIRTYIKESINAEYLRAVEGILENSLYTLDGSLRTLRTSVDVVGLLEKDQYVKPESYFNIPLALGENLLGVMTITSKRKATYSIQDIEMLYRIVHQALGALERLESVVETEKGKLNAMITSLPNGAIMFLIENGLIKLSFANNASREFLHIEGTANTVNIVSAFGPIFDLIKEVNTIMHDKKNIVFNNVVLNDKHFQVTLSPVFLYNSQMIIGVSVTMDDITLEVEVEKMREDFTNMMVHELRSPLTTIRGAADLLLGGKLAGEEQTKMLSFIRDSTKRLLTDIGDLLDAAKIDAGKFSIMLEPADISELVNTKVGDFVSLAKEKSIALKVEIEPSLPKFEFDKERIGQVLANLISNSLKFTNNNGEITAFARKNGEEIIVGVRDNGVGIPEEKQKQLFSKYAQMKSKSMHKGTGLGLYISKGIVESHGGKIWIESEEGKGAEIAFSLPIHQKEQTAKTDDVKAESSSAITSPTATPQHLVN